MSRMRNSRLLSVGMPIVFVFFGFVMVFIQYRRLSDANSSLADSQKKLDSLNAIVAKAKIEPEGDKIPVVPATREEDTRFLEGLKRTAQETGTQLVKWVSTIRPAGSQPGVTSTGNTPPSELKNVYEVLGDLEVYGDYNAVRAFVQRLEAGPRLLNMNNVTWRRGIKSGTRLQMTVIRYVSDLSSSSSSNGASESGLVTRSSGGTP